jgi:hypothetical protein
MREEGLTTPPAPALELIIHLPLEMEREQWMRLIIDTASE